MRISGRYYSYLRYEPVSQHLAVVSTLAERMHEESEDTTEEKLMSAMSDTAEFVSGKPYWRGMAEVSDALRGRNPKFLQNLLSSRITPPGLAFATRRADPLLRKPEGLVESLLSRIPGASKALPPRLGAFGEPIERKGPEIKEDKVVDELMRLDVSLERQGKSFLGYPLTRESVFKIERESGPIFRKILDRIVSTPGYDALSDEQKFMLLQGVIRKTRDFSRKTEVLALAAQGRLEAKEK